MKNNLENIIYIKYILKNKLDLIIIESIIL